MTTNITIPRATLEQLVGALSDIKHGLEGSRIWGGMEWTYNPLHSFKYLPLRDKADTAINAGRAALEGAQQGERQPEERIRLTDGEWPIIELGFGKVEVAEGWQGEVPALIFGHNGTGQIGEPTQPDRVHLAGETIAVVTFANVESLDVVAGKLATIRAERFAAAPAPQPAQGELEKLRAPLIQWHRNMAEVCRDSDGTSYLNHRDTAALLQSAHPIDTFRGCVEKTGNGGHDAQPPHECKTEAEKLAYAAGWWKALEVNKVVRLVSERGIKEVK